MRARPNPVAGKRLVALLEQAGRAEARAHAEAQQPWGSCKVVHRGPGFRVMETVVVPGARLSLRGHGHRAEHWLVIAGTAKLTVHGEVVTLEPNQGVQVPPGASCRLENPGEVPLRMIEVLWGDDLGEHGVARYDGVHGGG